MKENMIMYSRRTFLKTAAIANFGILAGPAWLKAAKTAGRKPNIVLIMADDLGYECIGANGGKSYNTPVLDKLAAGSVRFTNCFANPLCTPSRVKIMTGMYNVRNYVKFGVMDRGQTTFAHQLKKAGYATCISGKWQLGKEIDSPRHFGFDESCLWQHTRGRVKTSGQGKPDSRFPNPALEINGKEKDYTDGEYGPAICTDFICDFMEKNKERPFLVYYPMILTHCPFRPTPDSADWDPKDPGSVSYKGDARYFSDMVAYTDKLVGRIIKKLEELGLRNDTLIMFTGDNGTDKPVVSEMDDMKVAGGKGQVNDNGTRAPLIVDWPGKVKAGLVSDDLVDFSDFLPTMCEASGTPLPEDRPIDGISLMPVLTGNGKRTKPWIYIWYSGQTWTRTREYGLIESKGKAEFFHYPGHYQNEKLDVEKLDGKARTAHEMLRKVIDDLAATQPAKSRKKKSAKK